MMPKNFYAGVNKAFKLISLLKNGISEESNVK